MISLIGNDLGYLYLILLAIFLVFGIPLILLIIGISLKNKKASKVLLIIAVIYTIIGFGICGGAMI